MNESELRALVREAIARQRPGDSGTAGTTGTTGTETHPSHTQYITLINIGDACLIEPSVECTHCGYCKSHGH